MTAVFLQDQLWGVNIIHPGHIGMVERMSPVRYALLPPFVILVTAAV
jgi:hypothetical protein